VDLDYVPDPMVLRAAELFVGGRQYCRQTQQLDDEKVWPIIQKNIDGILAFFHVLMTRERIPLIDYEYTFPSDFLRSLMGEITLEVHPSRSVYETIKADGLQKLRTFDATRLPKKLVDNLGNELLAVGYSWVPELDGLSVDPTDQEVASFILGGLIFGGYAQASGSDHLLQNQRAAMFVALSGTNGPSMTRGIKKERELFAALNKLTNQDEQFRVEQEEAPPTVLHHLLSHGIDNTRRLLEEALKLRDSSAGQRYRLWHTQLRNAWRLGHCDTNAEAELKAVAEELTRRLSGKPLVLTKLTVEGSASASVGANLGMAEASVSASARTTPMTVSVTVPNRLRNWFVDQFCLERHQKLLLEWSLDRRSFDDLAFGMKTAWSTTS
jgi:hypothetical protein